MHRMHCVRSSEQSQQSLYLRRHISGLSQTRLKLPLPIDLIPVGQLGTQKPSRR